tara:strand:- start:593 stop:799 length:207 start_codon:yes stop_codon:yes gene_type:complete
LRLLTNRPIPNFKIQNNRIKGVRKSAKPKESSKNQKTINTQMPTQSEHAVGSIYNKNPLRIAEDMEAI